MTRSHLGTLLVFAASALPPRAALAQASPYGPTSSPPATEAPAVVVVPVRADGPEDACRGQWAFAGRCAHRRWAGPRLMLGLELGVSAMNETNPFGFSDGVGAVTSAGPEWGLRIGVELLPWLALEARYLGMNNAAQGSATPAGSLAFLTSGVLGVLRLTAPLPFVHPYVFTGLGYYDVALLGSPEARAGSVLHSSSQAGIPMGIGVDVPLTWHLSIGAEATYHFQLSESYASVTTNGIDGGDFTTFSVVMRTRF